MFTRLKKFWYFHCANPTVRQGEFGGYKWRFRRFWLEIRTVSGNFKVRFTASAHPYGYLLAGKTDENIRGFAAIMYQIGTLVTTEQQFADDIGKALNAYLGRLMATPADESDSEEAALEEVKAVQEYVEMPPKERRRYERDVNGRFKKRVKEIS